MQNTDKIVVKGSNLTGNNAVTACKKDSIQGKSNVGDTTIQGSIAGQTKQSSTEGVTHAGEQTSINTENRVKKGTSTLRRRPQTLNQIYETVADQKAHDSSTKVNLQI